MCAEKNGSLDSAEILKVLSDEQRHKKRHKQVFNTHDSNDIKLSCTSGGCPPDVVVEFRVSKSHYGKFGFDWLRIGDADVAIPESDIPYTSNIGYHYYKTQDSKGKSVDTLCTKDSQINTGQAIFKIDATKQQLLFNKFTTLAKLTPMDVDNPKTEDDETLPAFKRDFRYLIPVITLMPKDVTKNPDSVNLEALLDVNVYTGEVKPEALKLGFETVEDKNIFNEASKINKMNLFKESKKGQVKITSIGTLTKDITVYVYASNKTGGTYVRGAFKVLRNDRVKDVSVLYIGTRVNAKNKREIQEKHPPEIDEKELRSKLGQALINIKEIKKEDKEGNPYIVDVIGQVDWTTVNVPNDDYIPWKHEKYKLDEDGKKIENPHYDKEKYEEYLPNPKYDKENPKKHPEFTKNENYEKPPEPRIDKEGLDFDNLMNKLELAYYNAYELPANATCITYDEIIRVDSDGTKYQIGKYKMVQNAFPANTFRCYFLADQAVSRLHETVADGGGTPGASRSMFFGDGGSRIGTLVHELGHNLGLKHTFTNDAHLVYKFNSTDNFMDYSHANEVFYHWQWKQMNSEGIT